MASWLAIVSTSLLVLVSFQTVNSDEPPPTTTLSPSSGGAGFSVGSGGQFVVRQVSTNSGFNRPYGRNTQQQQFMSFQRPYMRTMHYRAPLYRHVNVVRIPYYYTRVYTYIPPPLRYFFTNFDAGNKQFDFTTNDGSASVGDGGAVISFGGAGNEEMKFGGSGSMISMAEQQQQQQQMQQQQQQQQMQQQQQQQQMQQQQQQQQQMQQLMQQQQQQQMQQQQQEQAAFAARQQAMTEAMTSHWAMKGAHAGGGGFLGGRGMTASFNSNGDQVFEQFSSHSGMMGGPRFGPAPQVNSPVLPNVGPGNMGPQVNPSFAK